MLSQTDNEILVRVGKGTPMGELMRQYWVPALPSAEFPEPDSSPKRMRLLGENLVMFRDSKGEMGCFVEACPHRGASLFFGRNEEEGLRCVYHGWKFDTTGACVDMPSEPAESNFKNKVRIRAYPCRDVNHMVWVYMGDRAVPPPFPQFEVNTLPPENVAPPAIMMEESNWFQNLEGDTDSNHLDYLHSRLDAFRWRLFGEKPAEGSRPGLFFTVWSDKMPRLDVRNTEYGVFYSARRKWDDEFGHRRPGDNTPYEWHRINQFIFPFHTMITGQNGVTLRSFVPLDDEWAMLITQRGSYTQKMFDAEHPQPTPLESQVGFVERTSNPQSYFYTKANKHNDYQRDFNVERTQMVSGVPAIGNLQDRAMTELMSNERGEVIYDRSHEHLGSLDIMCIAVRRRVIKAAKELRDHGILPPNVDNVELDIVRPATVVLPEGTDWVAATEKIRDGKSGMPPAHEIKPLAYLDGFKQTVEAEVVAGGGGGG
jgi:phenylpropionate dioxygenase-like ring-hydroxylating dioxygenase large terminal subunit